MRNALGLLWALISLAIGISAAMWLGIVAVLPFVVVPRGKRERYTIRTAGLWAELVIRGLLFARPRISGDSGLRDDQGALFLCNHRSWLDPMMMIRWTRSQGLSKAEIKYIPFVGQFGYLTGAVFFDRSSLAERKRAREETMWLVSQGARVHVFPEGTRTRDGELSEKVYLTLPQDCWAAKIPVVPCAVMHTEDVLPADRVAAFPGKGCRLHIGRYVDPADFPDAESFGKACWARVVEEVAMLTAEPPPA